MRLNPRQREHLANLFSNSANVILASLVIGQIIEAAVRWGRVVAGLIVYGVLVILTTKLRKGGD